ncbi:four helix bundle protein [Rubrivirga sp. S365]|uniref:Four helix bundle protein n=1 Tax=Rubrivirga litoralis TaxID=3075598 RepID=A0ABU3BRJ1_9BACT|nr:MULTISPECIES: four helix bundle protein [unclassified Rubrivirga]MDT0631903.1 four helix bundle protein [Rubrivirga sp. F394]MDT7857956.1 four helix bundle protein [Rubrivirga sp. S365]
MGTFRRFEEIEAWKLGRELNRLVYEATAGGAFAKDFALRDQIRRASISVSSNVAEGYARRSPADFARFLTIARASAAEVRSQLYLALDLGYLDTDTFDALYDLARRAGGACGGLARYLRTAPPRATREPGAEWSLDVSDDETLNPEP